MVVMRSDVGDPPGPPSPHLSRKVFHQNTLSMDFTCAFVYRRGTVLRSQTSSRGLCVKFSWPLGVCISQPVRMPHSSESRCGAFSFET